MKSGIWGSGLDTLLLALRTAIRDNEEPRFPLADVESAMTLRGKSLRFEDDEIEDLASMSFGDRRVFPVLSLPYPGMDFRNEFHIDHVFPRASLTRPRLLEAGFDQERIDMVEDRVNRLPNLQLLEGPVNTSKSAKLPMDWLVSHYPDKSARDYYRARHDLGEVPESIHAFEDFYEARQARIAGRLGRLLGIRNSE